MSSDTPKNIVLIGMPGAGKSTIGVLLAKAMCREFIDTDLYIQSKESRKLQDIIDSQGMAFFCLLEEKYVTGLSFRNAVIATGGSVVYSRAAMEHLGGSGTICHLYLPLASLEERLSNFDDRGVVRRPGQSLSDLFEERMPLYRKYSDMEIDCTGKGHDELVSLILANIDGRQG